MADFVAVIRRAVDGLADNTPEHRERVYQKARGAVRRQLENMSPPPSDEVVRRQIEKLDAAIGEVELEHTEALPEVDEAAPAVVASEVPEAKDETGKRRQAADERPAVEPERFVEEETDEAAGETDLAAAGPAVGSASYHYEPAWHSEPTLDDEEAETPSVPRHGAGRAEDEAEARAVDEEGGAFPWETGAMPSAFANEHLDDDTHDTAFGLGDRRPIPASRKTRRRRGVLVTLVLVLTVAAAAYGLWTNRTSVAPLLASLSSLTGQTSGTDETPAGSKPSTSAAPPSTTEDNDRKAASETPPASSGGAGDTGSEPATKPADEAADAASGKPATDTTAQDATQSKPAQPAHAGPDGGKFTQRLMADGSETDPGPAPQANASQTTNEGRSIAARQAASASTAPGAEGGSAAPSAAATAKTADGDNAEATISQKMYLYEERFNDKAPSATTGSVVWSLAKESSGDATSPSVPAIHGEISVPDKGLTALVTIKPNMDPSLPASDLIEIVFALPGDFAGGGIESVESVSLKPTEEARGDPLIAVPAKITDNFFMVALNDYPQAVKSNLDLLKSRNWIDIPITYTSGRRALITLEKGASGNQVFDKALQAWSTIDRKQTSSAGDADTNANNDTDKSAPAGPPEQP